MKEKFILFIAYFIKFFKDDFYDIVIYLLFVISHLIAYFYYFNLYN